MNLEFQDAPTARPYQIQDSRPDPKRDPKRQLVLEIKGNSLDDGPGIRTVVFFKGCPLSCVWCHNPESKQAGPEISFDARECVGCDTCLEVCGEGALDRANPGFIDRSRCTLCYECIDPCPSGALARVGRHMEVAEILAEVEKDLPFFRTSGGGVTLSGGEPTLFMDYAADLLSGLRSMGAHSIIETCGLFEYDEFEAKVLPVVDTIYFDLKVIDDSVHRELCGASNALILENFVKLVALSRAGGPEVLPRVPLIPNMTATDENLEAIAGILHENMVGRLAVLEYNPLWVEKSAKIGRSGPAGEGSEWTSWMDRSEVSRCRAVFNDFDLT